MCKVSRECTVGMQFKQSYCELSGVDLGFQKGGANSRGHVEIFVQMFTAACLRILTRTFLVAGFKNF